MGGIRMRTPVFFSRGNSRPLRTPRIGRSRVKLLAAPMRTPPWSSDALLPNATVPAAWFQLLATTAAVHATTACGCARNAWSPPFLVSGPILSVRRLRFRAPLTLTLLLSRTLHSDSWLHEVLVDRIR